MEFNGSQTIKAPRSLVWKCLNDPAVLKECVPGCQSFTAESDDEFRATVTVAVGPVKANFKGNLKLSDRIAPQGYRIVGQGEGGIAGFGKMNAEVALTEEGDDTVLSYVAYAEVGGKLAQIGTRLVSSVANKLAATFFQRFTDNVSELAARQ
ncbi:MAG TPA: carbon monoxide dehydrogenase subunit G [Paraburkholderia sp.]